MGRVARRREWVPQTHPGSRVKNVEPAPKADPECRAWLLGLGVLLVLLVIFLPLGGSRDSRLSNSLAARLGAAVVEVPVR